MKQWYEELFEDYADGYEKECFTQGTVGEVDFLESEIGGDRSRRILDIGCGTGRHAVELAARGYRVTGIDLSESMLARARENARRRGVQVEFLRADARDLRFSKEFDLVTMLCEGAFPLMETDEMNHKILANAAAALREPGKFIFTTLNGLFPLFHSVKEFLDAKASGASAGEQKFDLLTFRERSTVEVTDDHGNRKVLRCDERYYVPPEISWLLKSLGFAKVAIHGCKLGAWSRGDPLTTEDFEMLVIAEMS
jgi:SAM-dependent methyltransferase